MSKLPRRKIVKRREEFQAFYSCGRYYANRYLVLYLAKNDEDKEKVGFAAGKKLGHAVVRNRVKRLLREAYRLNSYKLAVGHKVLLVGRRHLVGQKLSVVEKAFLDLASKAGILQHGIILMGTEN